MIEVNKKQIITDLLRKLKTEIETLDDGDYIDIKIINKEDSHGYDLTLSKSINVKEIAFHEKSVNRIKL